MEVHPKNDPVMPYISHIIGPSAHVSKKQLITMGGLWITIIMKSEKAKFKTSRFDGVRNDFVVENM